MKGRGRNLKLGPSTAWGATQFLAHLHQCDGCCLTPPAPAGSNGVAGKQGSDFPNELV